MDVLENKRLEPQAKTFKDRITEKIAAFHTKSKKKNEDGGGKSEPNFSLLLPSK